MVSELGQGRMRCHGSLGGIIETGSNHVKLFDGTGAEETVQMRIRLQSIYVHANIGIYANKHNIKMKIQNKNIIN